MSPKKNKIRKAVSKEQKLENAAIARFTRILSRTKYQEHGLPDGNSHANPEHLPSEVQAGRLAVG